MHPRLIQHLVRHPVAHARRKRLLQQHRFDGAPLPAQRGRKLGLRRPVEQRVPAQGGDRRTRLGRRQEAHLRAGQGAGGRWRARGRQHSTRHVAGTAGGAAGTREASRAALRPAPPARPAPRRALAKRRASQKASCVPSSNSSSSFTKLGGRKEGRRGEGDSRRGHGHGKRPPRARHQRLTASTPRPSAVAGAALQRTAAANWRRQWQTTCSEPRRRCGAGRRGVGGRQGAAGMRPVAPRARCIVITLNPLTRCAGISLETAPASPSMSPPRTP